MADQSDPTPDGPTADGPTADGTVPVPVEHPEVVPAEVVPAAVEPEEERRSGESVEQPAKVMRIGSMIRQMLEEVRQAPLDEAGRSRLKEIYESSVKELADGLSPDLRDELDRLVMPFEQGSPSESELRIAQAQLVGWLEGLFHGIQATLFAQQMAARQQLEEMHRRGLPPGQAGPPEPGQREPGQTDMGPRPGTYL